jgi:hypothetical protein
VCTSDEFFGRFSIDDIHFDVVFVDGLHTFRQAYRDVINAFRLCPNGIVLMDDVVPIDEASAIPDFDAAVEAATRLEVSRPVTMWHGDVFRVVLSLDYFHPELEFSTIEAPGNPQTLIWKKQASATLEEISDSELKVVEGIEYVDVFSQGIPNHFRPTAEDDALMRALSGCLAGRN